MDGIHGIALAERYGDDVAQALPDIEFLADAGDRGWGVLIQNPRMWQVPTSAPAFSTTGPECSSRTTFVPGLSRLESRRRAWWVR